MIKPKLVIVTDNFLPRKDGITRFLSTLLPYLKEQYDIKIICPDFKHNNVKVEGVKFVRIPLSNKYIGDFKTAKFKPFKVSKAIDDADLIFVQTLGAIGSAAVYFGHKKHKKVLTFVHSLEWKLVPSNIKFKLLRKLAIPFIKLFAKYLYKKCDYIIVPSERIGDYLSWENITKPKEIINLGVDSDKFAPYYQNPNRLMTRAMHNIQENDIVIGYHGRISAEKDLHTLVRAFVKLRNKYKNIKLMLVGSGIPNLINQFKKQPGVIHIKGTPNVEEYLSLMDIYCMPSLTETTSLSTLEAMSTSLPVVTTGAGFIKDYIKHSYNGLIFPKKDSFHLAKMLEFLIDHPEKRIQYGQNSRIIVKKDFTWEKTAQRLINFLNDLLKESCDET